MKLCSKFLDVFLKIHKHPPSLRITQRCTRRVLHFYWKDFFTYPKNLKIVRPVRADAILVFNAWRVRPGESAKTTKGYGVGRDVQTLMGGDPSVVLAPLKFITNQDGIKIATVRSKRATQSQSKEL